MAEKRVIEGTLRLNGERKLNYPVRLEMLNPKVNRNNWRYENIPGHLKEFGDIPILYSVIDGKVANGHDFEIVTDPKTGKEYASFIGATSEKAGGFINLYNPGTDELNPRIEDIDGTDWVVADGVLWSWYNKELIDELESHSGQMKVSIETLVNKFHMEGDVEVEEEWKVIGVTIISVTEAVAGANIRKLSAEDICELEGLKIRAASYDDNVGIDNKMQKNNQRSKKKMTLEQLKKLVGDNVRILAYDDSKVVLLSNSEIMTAPIETDAEGNFSLGQMKNASIKIEDLDASELAVVIKENEETLGKLRNDCEVEKQGRLTAEATIAEMQAAEKVRRNEVCKKTLERKIEEIKTQSGIEISDDSFNSIKEKVNSGAYDGLVDANKKFIGEEELCKDINNVAMELLMKEQKAKLAANSKKFAWGFENGGTGNDNDTANSVKKFM